MAFLKKIRAKEGATMALTPASFRATGACSREEPHPKFFPATMIVLLSLSVRSGSRSLKI